MLGTQRSLILLASLAACGGSPKKSAPAPSAPATVPARPATASSEPVAASPNVAVSADLAKQCALRFENADAAPKFALDEAELLPEDRNILEQVAQCLTRGPLQARSVQLIGRADPRGTDEYNLSLGTRRAETVRTYLQRLGVPATRLAPTTRGELDASGTDETSWRRDRRVDLELVN